MRAPLYNSKTTSHLAPSQTQPVEGGTRLECVAGTLPVFTDELFVDKRFAWLISVRVILVFEYMHLKVGEMLRTYDMPCC